MQNPHKKIWGKEEMLRPWKNCPQLLLRAYLLWLKMKARLIVHNCETDFVFGPSLYNQQNTQWANRKLQEIIEFRAFISEFACVCQDIHVRNWWSDCEGLRHCLGLEVLGLKWAKWKLLIEFPFFFYNFSILPNLIGEDLGLGHSRFEPVMLLFLAVFQNAA